MSDKMPKWWGRKVNVKDEANRKERESAKARGLRRQPASGALPHAKGDLIGQYTLTDQKTTKRQSFTITKAMWEKVRREALEMGREMANIEVVMEGVESLTVCRTVDYDMLLDMYARMREALEE
jgi:hypothetical protein